MGNPGSNNGYLRDVTNFHGIEKLNKVTLDLLGLINKNRDLKDLLTSVLKLIRENFQFECSGIRLKDGEDFPYIVHYGLNDGFVKAENFLCKKNAGNLILDSDGNPMLQCICGNVISGRIRPVKPYYTEKGSFWTNSTTEILPSINSDIDIENARNRCQKEGFESVMLVPLRFGKKIYGLLQVTDHRRNLFSNGLVNFFEGFCEYLSTAIERIIIENELEKKEASLRAVIENADGSIWSIDRNYRLTESNQMFIERFLKGTGKKLKPGDEILSSMPDVLKNEWTRYYERGLAGEHFSIQTWTIKPLDPEYYDYSFNPVVNTAGTVTGLTIIGHNITKLISAENELKKNEERLRHITESSGEWIWEVDKNGLYTYVSPLSKSLLGYAPDEILGKKYFFDFFAPEVKEELKNSALKVFRQKKIFRKFENPNLHRDGHLVILETSGFPVFNEDGELVGYRGADSDITSTKVMQRALEESEKKYRNLFENSVVPIWEEDFSDVNKLFTQLKRKKVKNFSKYFDKHPEILEECASLIKIVDVNETSVEFFGLKSKEDLQLNLKNFFVPESFDSFKKEMIALAEGNYEFHTDLPIKTSENEVKYIHLILQVQPGHYETLSRVTVSWIDITDRINYEKNLKKASDLLRNLNRHLEEARENERSLISLNLHDDIGQKLTALKMDLAWVRKRFGIQSELVEKKLDSMEKLLDNSIETVQKISSDLRPPVLYDLGLPSAIEWMLKDRVWPSGIGVSFKIDPKEFFIDQKTEIAIYRVFQEAITNILRHSKASRVKVVLKKDIDQIILQVEDNGTGFRMETINNPKSLGLAGMRERINAFSGKFEIITSPGKGCLIKVTIPVKQADK